MISEYIGNTATVRLGRIEKYFGVRSAIYAKLERENPSGSVKDRAALHMIRSAVSEGRLCAGGRIIEATSGNMGISLSMLSAAMGISATIIMPEGMSPEREKIMRSYGAEVVLTEGRAGMAVAISLAERMASEGEGALMSQFTSRANILAHYNRTGPEIYRNMGGEIDLFVCGVGTGGTIGGVGQYLKQKRPSVKIYAVEPGESAVISGGAARTHGIEGIGAGFLPPLLNMRLIDGVICPTTEQAIEYATVLAKREGLFVGISSGAALFAALRLAEKNEGKNIVTLFPDGGEKYLSRARLSGEK